VVADVVAGRLEPGRAGVLLVLIVGLIATNKVGAGISQRPQARLLDFDAQVAKVCVSDGWISKELGNSVGPESGREKCGAYYELAAE